ncbi:DUF6155 family protein [Flavobacterium capsici]|uniref:DUF6155 family protein n=1 Tax=Flavobacterium capsici TaxID=3075618 RepID=A0AA96F221_9FLAO|nr:MULTISPECIES: DUF6155 family protein [unclassified Flavobacterium]WNM18152.1 DUF6155 family protein [Flavobacterium sp. PMR2A8]WNM22204.1 DUF6155 family protein [Flavobacterium sp. PMTSA4]
MSKRNLKNYLSELTKKQLQEQIMELYEKFGNVKIYYDFAFNPNEDKLSKEARVKISNEFFPVTRRKPKMRRSVAQKIIKHFIELGVDSFVIADIMLFSIEIAQSFTAEKPIKQEAFYKSMFNTFKQAIEFVVEKGIYYDFKERIKAIEIEVSEQNWMNEFEFKALLEKL